MLKAQAIDLVEFSEAYTSSINPLDDKKLKKDKQFKEMVVKVFNPYVMTGTAHEGGGIKIFEVTARYLESDEVLLERDSIAPLNLVKKVDGRVVAFSNKSFAQTSSIVLANIATWVLSTHVAIRGRAYLFRLIRLIIIPNTPNNPCQLPSQSDIQLLTLQPILVCFIKLQ